MSESSPKIHGHQNGEHGTMKSYVIGFLLSLVFTAIPYYLVVEKVITGNSLLATILGVAVLQMAIQIFFFLHLGRGPKPLYNVIFFVGTVGIILVVVFGSIFIMDNLHYNMTPTEVTKKLAQNEAIDQVAGVDTGACQDILASHKVTIRGGKIVPNHVEAKLCDTLTFINEDDKMRDIAFGPHPNHDSYAGEEITVRRGRPETITLNQTGSFLFHDHLEPDVEGTLNVSP